MTRSNLVTFIGLARNLLKRASELKGDPDKGMPKSIKSFQAEVALACEMVKQFSCNDASTEEKAIDSLKKADKLASKIRSSHYVVPLSAIREEIARLISAIENRENDGVEPLNPSQEKANSQENSSSLVEEKAVEEKANETQAQVFMDAKEALKASHARAKELRQLNPELTYQAALKKAANEIYSRIPKKEKKENKPSKAISREEASGLLKKAHAIAKELRTKNREMTFQESLKVAFKQVYAAI